MGKNLTILNFLLVKCAQVMTIDGDQGVYATSEDPPMTDIVYDDVGMLD